MTDVSRLPGAFEESWSWQVRAACRGLDGNLFFHPSGERGEAHQEREAAAKQVCAGCPVRAECLRHALEAREHYGVWGGLAEDERAALLPPVRPRPAAAPARRRPRSRRPEPRRAPAAR
ncbi:WhiB family transcriptional regulator [Kitasatospora sp. NPDC088346]|uniref:WhiB family transcriptional regulator n=1 Tax=Kitasatospora sp. NPDC088346 TaxID=3364073 RepID=UPI0037FA6399